MPSRSLLLVGLLPLIALFYVQYSNVFLSSKNVVPLSRSKTPIVMASIPAFSHMEKITTIAEGLIQLGYPVSFLTGPEFEDYIESIGATYVPIEGKGPGLMAEDKMSTFLSLQGDELEIFAFKAIFLDEIPSQYRTLQRTFTDIRDKYGPEQPLIYIADCTFGGLAPVLLGADGIRPDAAISIGHVPYAAASNDTFPVRSGRHPDTSADSKRIHFEAQQAQYNSYPDREWNAHTRDVLAQMGATTSFASMFDMFASASDIFLQYGVPEFEYPRTDYRPNLKFIGAPVTVGIAERALPQWWGDVREAKKAGKRIVAVTSSSVIFDNNVLIIPALEALKERDDVLVIAALVTSDVEQFEFKTPENARVAKFIPLDLALPEVDVLITNGGYGTIQQSLRAGVPLIVTGVAQDKSHTGALINYIGNGIYNAVHETSPEMLSGAFEEILRNQSYRAKAEAIAKEYEKYNAVEIVDKEIQRVLEGKLLEKA
ncbi:glycosyltransferase family 1 protein [Macroventuria anomochaeta]|uniref:Glycosyltransferase family 1 protein n=1 Tax=Macroventuria anomochaeta TaxID=301207 RepID=A0ACB6RRY6_9PLEO|nr:glycosyltransferase family 1 protein [Macroventuria anomochaeta]KAF2623679.1 glycosyltransferase family 1 protein [Macroventuria anomochaeta]